LDALVHSAASETIILFLMANNYTVACLNVKFLGIHMSHIPMGRQVRTACALCVIPGPDINPSHSHLLRKSTEYKSVRAEGGKAQW
jgi:hypothetical protein